MKWRNIDPVTNQVSSYNEKPCELFTRNEDGFVQINFINSDFEGHSVMLGCCVGMLGVSASRLKLDCSNQHELSFEPFKLHL